MLDLEAQLAPVVSTAPAGGATLPEPARLPYVDNKYANHPTYRNLQFALQDLQHELKGRKLLPAGDELETLSLVYFLMMDTAQQIHRMWKYERALPYMTNTGQFIG